MDLVNFILMVSIFISYFFFNLFCLFSLIDLEISEIECYKIRLEYHRYLNINYPALQFHSLQALKSSGYLLTWISMLWSLKSWTNWYEVWNLDLSFCHSLSIQLNFKIYFSQSFLFWSLLYCNSQWRLNPL